jgi:hypothetical protein
LLASIEARLHLGKELIKFMQIDVGENRRDYAPHTKGNFQFERVVRGWRKTQILDLRLKK